MKPFNKDHILITLLTGVVVLVLSVITFNIPALNPLARGLKNISVTDLFFKLENQLNEPDTCQSIVIVDMTDLYSRADLGNMLSDIYDAHPKAIGVDLVFEGVKDDLEGNQVLEQAVEKIAPITIFSEKLTDYDAKSKEFHSVVQSYFRDLINIQEGYTNITDNMEKNIIRELTTTQNTSWGGKQYSFVEQLAQKAGIRQESNRNFSISYNPVRFHIIPYDKIKENHNLIRGKIVFVGTMTEEADCHMSPLGKMAGVEIQAFSLLTLLEHKNVTELSTPLSVIIGLFLCFIYELIFESIAVFSSRGKERWRMWIVDSQLLLTFAPMIYVPAITIFSYLLFEKYGICIDMVVVLILVGFVGLSRRLYIATRNFIANKKK